VARLLDVLVACAALVLLAPVMVLVAAAIFLEDGRPIFFSQLRLGHRGRHFRIHKFRKFRETRRPTGLSVTLANDPRLTRLGGFLARGKLDELPQLWNVLKGDMSLVGPRPETLDFQDCFKESYSTLLAYKPGIFGPSQVLFRSESSLYSGHTDPEQFYRTVLFPLKACIDLAYFPYRNLFWDLAWIIRGVLAVFGWSPPVRQGLRLAREADDWRRESRAEGRGLPGPILTYIGRWGGVGIPPDDGSKIAATVPIRSISALAAGTRSKRFVDRWVGSSRRISVPGGRR
jgi:lipopolysaccharide/colanic/teichoic acid biosynthesis glycosyltransferase